MGKTFINAIGVDSAKFGNEAYFITTCQQACYKLLPGTSCEIFACVDCRSSPMTHIYVTIN